MKKVIPLFALLFVFIFINCSKSNGSEEEITKIDKSANLLGTGDSSNDILSNSKYNKLKLEIAYVKNFRPTSTAMADLVEFLKELTYKENIEIEYKELTSTGKEKLSLQEVADLESENRTAYNTGNTLAIYIYFSDAPSEDDDPGKSLLITTGTVETATLNHEFGHLFGLVNLGTAMVNAHEGTTTDDNGNTIPSQHCDQDNCLMRAELEFGGAMGKMLVAKNGQVPDLDAECLLDLKANGGR